ncbi:MAG: fused MFS/spermidine synthase [Kiritimatiellae bacterium]|nr:fused MFS/spermidine synthase [Kiritimatiellia bacterium]
MKRSSSRQLIVTLILAAFFVSGFTSLIYEIIWVRMLTRYVGGSTFSVTIVLTVFMGGLALGSRIASAFVDRLSDRRDLVRLYGIIEAVIGAYAALFPLLLGAAKPLYAFVYRSVDANMILFGTCSAAISIVLLILPTTLMGATLPLLARYYIQETGGLGARTGRLYGINTIGAALGSLLCGIVMLRWLGVAKSLTLAITVNIGIGILFVLLMGGWGKLYGIRQRLQNAMSAKNSHIPRRHRSVLILLAVSGACSMAYEVIWTKLLALLVGPTTYSFTLVLFTFITGLAFGSMLFGWIGDRVRRPFHLLITTQFVAAATALLCSQFLGNSQMFFAKLLYIFRGSLPLLETAKGAAVFTAMFPTTVMLGAVFPLATRVAAQDVKSVGSVVGRLYMFNTIGAVTGSLCAGFLLVPLLGKADSLSLLALMQVAVALAALLAIAVKDTDRPTQIRACTIGVALMAAALFLPRWDIVSLTKGRYHRFHEFAEYLDQTGLFEAAWSSPRLDQNLPDTTRHLFVEDGIGGFVSVAESVSGLGSTNVFLTISGKTDASSAGDLHTMTLTGQVPMLLHPHAKKAMVVGLASGITGGEMLHYPLEQLDILEISPEVVRACRYFDRWNNGVLDDSRTKLILQDARTHILLADETYDVIVSEPSNPWMAGVANLFTVEYFREVRKHLAPDGVFVQWYHAYQTDWESFCLVGRTLSQVFPNNCIVKTSTTGSDYLLLAFADSRSLTERLTNVPTAMPYARASSNMQMPTPDVLLPLVVAENTAELYGTGLIHSDAQPHLEFITLHGLYKETTDILHHLVEGARVSPYVSEGMRQLAEPEKRLDLAEFMASMNVEPYGLSGLAADASVTLLARRERIIENFARRTKGEGYDRILDPVEKTLCLAVHERELMRRTSTQPRSTEDLAYLALTHFDLGNVYVARQEWQAAATAFLQAEFLSPGYSAALANLARCYDRLGQHVPAATAYARLLLLDPNNGQLWARFAATHIRKGDLQLARSLFEHALEVNPLCAPALTAIGSLLLKEGDLQKAIETLKKALEVDPRALRAYQNVAVALIDAGRPQEAMHYIEFGLYVHPGDNFLLRLKAALVNEPISAAASAAP